MSELPQIDENAFKEKLMRMSRTPPVKLSWFDRLLLLSVTFFTITLLASCAIDLWDTYVSPINPDKPKRVKKVLKPTLENHVRRLMGYPEREYPDIIDVDDPRHSQYRGKRNRRGNKPSQ